MTETVPQTYTSVNGNSWETTALAKVERARRTKVERSDPRRMVMLDWLEQFLLASVEER